jgi:hypothetical protein
LKGRRMEHTTISDEYAAAWIEAPRQVQQKAGGVGRARPQVRVTAVDPADPEALREYFGCGKLDTFTPRTAPHLTLYVWQVRGKAAAEVLERTVPYMMSDIRRDVEYILKSKYFSICKLHIASLWRRKRRRRQI